MIVTKMEHDVEDIRVLNRSGIGKKVRLPSLGPPYHIPVGGRKDG